MREIWCDYCNGFHPIRTEESGVYCSHCNALAVRMNSRGFMLCDNCHDYRDGREQFQKKQEADLKSDIVCPQCAAVMATLRYPMPQAV